MKILHIAALVVAVTAGTATIATAELFKITDRTDFIELVDGKTLSRPLVRLRVAPNGLIQGRGATWDVTGSWSWREGYFCRELTWGGDDLGYNCQEVHADGRRIRFISDRGAGDSAEFRLR